VSEVRRAHIHKSRQKRISSISFGYSRTSYQSACCAELHPADTMKSRETGETSSIVALRAAGAMKKQAQHVCESTAAADACAARQICKKIAQAHMRQICVEQNAFTDTKKHILFTVNPENVTTQQRAEPRRRCRKEGSRKDRYMQSRIFIQHICTMLLAADGAAERRRGNRTMVDSMVKETSSGDMLIHPEHSVREREETGGTRARKRRGRNICCMAAYTQSMLQNKDVMKATTWQAAAPRNAGRGAANAPVAGWRRSTHAQFCACAALLRGSRRTRGTATACGARQRRL